MKFYIKTCLVVFLSYLSILQNVSAQTETIQIPPEEIEFYALLMETPLELIHVSSESIDLGGTGQSQTTRHQKTYKFSNTGSSTDFTWVYVDVTFTVQGGKFKNFISATSWLSSWSPFLSWSQTSYGYSISSSGKQLDWNVKGNMQVGINFFGNHWGSSSSRIYSGTIYLDDFGLVDSDEADESLIGVHHH